MPGLHWSLPKANVGDCFYTILISAKENSTVVPNKHIKEAILFLEEWSRDTSEYNLYIFRLPSSSLALRNVHLTYNHLNVFTYLPCFLNIRMDMPPCLPEYASSVVNCFLYQYNLMFYVFWLILSWILYQMWLRYFYLFFPSTLLVYSLIAFAVESACIFASEVCFL